MEPKPPHSKGWIAVQVALVFLFAASFWYMFGFQAGLGVFGYFAIGVVVTMGLSKLFKLIKKTPTGLRIFAILISLVCALLWTWVFWFVSQLAGWGDGFTTGLNFQAALLFLIPYGYILGLFLAALFPRSRLMQRLYVVARFLLIPISVLCALIAISTGTILLAFLIFVLIYVPFSIWKALNQKFSPTDASPLKL